MDRRYTDRQAGQAWMRVGPRGQKGTRPEQAGEEATEGSYSTQREIRPLTGQNTHQHVAPLKTVAPLSKLPNRDPQQPRPQTPEELSDRNTPQCAGPRNACPALRDLTRLHPRGTTLRRATETPQGERRAAPDPTGPITKGTRLHARGEHACAYRAGDHCYNPACGAVLNRCRGAGCTEWRAAVAW